jgi:hypothetical protein
LSIAMPVRYLSLPRLCSSNTSQQHVHAKPVVAAQAAEVLHVLHWLARHSS